MTTATIRDCEFEFGPVSIGLYGEIAVDVEREWNGFSVTDVRVDGKRADAWLTEAMKHWVAGDITLGDKSRVRKAFDDADWLSCPASEAADARADYERDVRRDLA